jgi:DNA-binding SARP family transcriptional activator
MEIRILGPLRLLQDGGEPIPLAGAAQRRLVSLLALRPGAVVTADALSDHLGLSPGALRTSISRVRRLVGSDVLVTVPPGYQLRARSVDSVRFEELVSLGLATADPSVSRSHIESALGLWRGDPFAEFAHEPWAVAEAWRLAEAQAGAIEHLAGLLLDQAEWTAAIIRLEPLIAAHPFRDRPRALLMRALAESGRRTEALRAFQSYRHLLVEETGLEPSAPLLALESAIATAPSGDP